MADTNPAIVFARALTTFSQLDRGAAKPRPGGWFFMVVDGSKSDVSKMRIDPSTDIYDRYRSRASDITCSLSPSSMHSPTDGSTRAPGRKEHCYPGDGGDGYGYGVGGGDVISSPMEGQRWRVHIPR